MALKMHKTSFEELTYANICPGTWRIFAKWDKEDNCRAVGPQYATKIELLCDLQRFAKECGL
jgi:hypothetical protein